MTRKPENKWRCVKCKKRKVVSKFNDGYNSRSQQKLCRDCTAIPIGLTNPDDIIRKGLNLRRVA